MVSAVSMMVHLGIAASASRLKRPNHFSIRNSVAVQVVMAKFALTANPSDIRVVRGADRGIGDGDMDADVAEF
jgi:hypothetical protein